MAAAGVGERAAGGVIDAVPDGEVFVAVLRALEGLIQRGQHLVGLSHVGAGKGAGANDIADGDGEQRGVQAVPGDVDEIEREVIVIDPMIADGIAAERGRRNVAPIDRDRSLPSAAGCSRGRI